MCTYNILEKKLVHVRSDLSPTGEHRRTFTTCWQIWHKISAYVTLDNVILKEPPIRIFEESNMMRQADAYPSISVQRLSEPGNTKYLNLLLNDTNGSNNKEMNRDEDYDIWQNIYFDGIGTLIDSLL